MVRSCSIIAHLRMQQLRKQTAADAHTCAIEALEPLTCTLSRACQGILCFSLDKRLTWMAGFKVITEVDSQPAEAYRLPSRTQ